MVIVSLSTLVILYAFQKNESPPSPDDSKDGLYASRVSNIWNKATVAKLRRDAMRAQQSGRNYRMPSNHRTGCSDLFLRGAIFRNFRMPIFTALFFVKLG